MYKVFRGILFTAENWSKLAKLSKDHFLNASNKLWELLAFCIYKLKTKTHLKPELKMKVV